MVLNIVVSQERFEHELARHGLIDAIRGTDRGLTEDLLRQYCETENGVPVNGHDIIRAALTGYIRRVVIDGQGVVTDFGRKRRLFSGAAREALKLMIDGCEHIGCAVRPTSCQIDHIDEWVRDGGATDLANGALKCSTQNRHKHRLGITEARDANGTLVQYRPRRHPDPPSRTTAPNPPTRPATPSDGSSSCRSRNAVITDAVRTIHLVRLGPSSTPDSWPDARSGCESVARSGPLHHAGMGVASGIRRCGTRA